MRRPRWSRSQSHCFTRVTLSCGRPQGPRAQRLRHEFAGTPVMAHESHSAPRPNRAAEINWHTWSATAFEEAKITARPILLSISAVWCHWCHVMDETTYSHAGIIDLINREYVPIRVDNDVRPDINQRYNMGGWPSTAFLTSSGDILTGATYLPP